MGHPVRERVLHMRIHMRMCMYHDMSIRVGALIGRRVYTNAYNETRVRNAGSQYGSLYLYPLPYVHNADRGRQEPPHAGTRHGQPVQLRHATHRAPPAAPARPPTRPTATPSMLEYGV